MLFEDSIKDEYSKKIYNKLMKGVLFKTIEEKKQFKLICFWKACKNFDPNKANFHTHLYNTIFYSKLKYLEQCSKENKIMNLNFELRNCFEDVKDKNSLFIEECIPDYLLDTYKKVFIEKHSISFLKKTNKNIEKEIKELKKIIKENIYQ